MTFRRKGIATKLLKFMIDDLSDRGYEYVWLKKETSSQIYEALGFVNFLEAIYQIDIDTEAIILDFKQKQGCEKKTLITRYGDTRLVKILG